MPGLPVVAIPDLAGVSLEQAISRLTATRLRVGDVKVVDSDKPALSVIE